MITTSLNELPEQPVSHNPEIKKKVMLKLGDLPHLTNFSQARFAPGQSAPAHAHQDMSELTLPRLFKFRYAHLNKKSGDSLRST